MSKRGTLISMGICLVASLLLFCVGIYASRINVTTMSFAVKFEQDVYAKVYVKTSDTNKNYYNGTDAFTTTGALLVADSYSNSEGILDSGKSITGATCDKYGYFFLYIYIENYSNFDIWSDINVTTEDGDVTKDLNQIENLAYNTNSWELMDRKENTTVDTSLRIITVKADQDFEKELTVNVSLHENYEYLQNNSANGQQPYINTGYNLTSNSRVQTQFEILNTAQNGFIFGGRTTSSSKNFELYSTTQFRRDYFSGGVFVGSADSPLITNHIYNIDFNKNVLSIDGTEYAGSALPTQQSTIYSCYIFGLNQANSLMSSYVRDIKMYSFKIYEEDVLVRDFIPAKNTSNVACMYDKVTKQFYLNANATGTFTIGNNYTQFDYLQSSGTQYIDTNFVPNHNTTTDIFYTQSSTGNFLFGSRTNSASGNRYALYLNSNTSIYPQYNSAINSGINVTPVGDINHIIFDKNIVYSNGTAVHTFDTSLMDFTCPHTMALFGIKQNFPTSDVVTVTDRNFVGKIYKCKIYDNGTLVRDYVPAKIGSQIGLYDRVTHTLFTNAGTGTFTIG